jgi:hypothetical protein
MTDPLDTHGMTMDGEPAMPILVAEYNALIGRVNEAEARAAVPSAPADEAAILRDAADALDADMERFFAEWPDEPRNSPYALGRKDAATELRRMAGEAQQPETQAFVCKCPAVLPATTDRADVLREPVNPCTRGNNFCGQHGYDCPPDEPAAGLPAGGAPHTKEARP